MYCCSSSLSGWEGIRKTPPFKPPTPPFVQSGVGLARFSLSAFVAPVSAGISASITGLAVRRAILQESIVVVASKSLKSQPVIVAQVDFTCVAVVLVTPESTVVANMLVV